MLNGSEGQNYSAVIDADRLAAMRNALVVPGSLAVQIDVGSQIWSTRQAGSMLH